MPWCVESSKLCIINSIFGQNKYNYRTGLVGEREDPASQNLGHTQSGFYRVAPAPKNDQDQILWYLTSWVEQNTCISE